MSPWLDLRVPPKEVKLPAVEAQTHRRFLKTHLPVDALVYSPKGQVPLRRPRRPRRRLEPVQPPRQRQRALVPGAQRHAGPGRPADRQAAASIREYFLEWMEKDGHPFWPFWENVRSWWEIRDLPNLLLVHFSELKADLPGQVRRIAAFLDIPVEQGAGTRSSSTAASPT
jgi:aryl sulfotransferase